MVIFLYSLDIFVWLQQGIQTEISKQEGIQIEHV